MLQFHVLKKNNWSVREKKTTPGWRGCATPEFTCIFNLWAALKWRQRGDGNTKDSFGEIAELQWEAFSLIVPLFERSVKQQTGSGITMRHLKLLENNDDDALYVSCTMQTIHQRLLLFHSDLHPAECSPAAATRARTHTHALIDTSNLI